MAHLIREISIQDVDAFQSLLSSIYDDAKYMVYNPGEYAPSQSAIISNLERMITSPTNNIFVAENDGKLVGYAIVETENLERAKHEAKFNMGVIKYSRERGLGQSLINAVEAWCLNRNIRRIEVSVVPENSTAVNLFKNAGYQIEGELRDKLYIDYKYYNKYVMAKLLL
ncbi:GNAT family N-acetyltransferase [Staphylococcus sp. SQ8-PEA]|uniref:GNAT family N-acetyltransferase n=1 Tax=Staphylococcus marylandisciuri TaxID=2981529 RepID=A0ABT2QP59_9STAP|nr:GNAT family N-acetyltransferase [Staphylococcus marylandisciuri]MCU5745759.1 GNAT family N-acetyltransferase [Staphylococcus marylandisciuri]